MEDIYESPQSIQLNPFEIKSTIKEIKDNLNSSNTIEVYSPTVSLLLLVLPKHSYYFLWNKETKNVEYLVRFRQIDIPNLPHKPVRQLLVYRDKLASKDSPFSAGFAKKIFWNKLFKTYQCCVSDSQQSDDGKEFWRYIIVDSFDKGLTVRILNTNDKTYQDIHSMEEFSLLDNKIYGTSSWFTRMLIAIY